MTLPSRQITSQNTYFVVSQCQPGSYLAVVKLNNFVVTNSITINATQQFSSFIVPVQLPPTAGQLQVVLYDSNGNALSEASALYTPQQQQQQPDVFQLMSNMVVMLSFVQMVMSVISRLP